MKILIAGGTGFIGSYLSDKFRQNGFEVRIVSRSNAHVQWNEAELISELEKTNVLINLAGKSINCRHTEENKKLIYDSRIETTKMLGNALSKCKSKPELWINASASAIYKPSTDFCSTESDFEQGDDFLATTVRDWENVFFQFQMPTIRQVALRTSVVLGKGGGAFEPLKMLTKYGLGGRAGNGKQFFSWIHIEDFYRVITFIIENKTISAVLNTTSPGPLTNAELMKVMRRSMGYFFGLPAPGFAIRIGARFLNTEADLILNSVLYSPQKLIRSDFIFKYPDCESAVNNLIKK